MARWAASFGRDLGNPARILPITMTAHWSRHHPKDTTMTLSGSIPVRPAIHSFTPRDVKIASWICFAWTVAVYDFVLFGNLLPVMAADLGLAAPGQK